MNIPLSIDQGAALMRDGGIVAFPTETVYGLGASVFHREAIQRIFLAKGRPSDNPLIIHISSLDQLDLVVKDPPEDFFLLAEAFFPGPLTILLPKSDGVPDLVSAGLPTVGIRMPDHPIARELIERVGVPVVAPSANISGKPSSTSAAHVWHDFGERIDGIIDGGTCHYGIESTVLSLSPSPQILRPGAISREEIEQLLGRNVILADGKSETPLSPGMKYRHYAPQAQVILFDNKEEFMKYQEKSHKRQMIVEHVSPQNLYAILRQADHDGFEEILIFCDVKLQKNQALMNRLLRASQ